MSLPASPGDAAEPAPTPPIRREYRGRFAPTPSGPLHLGSFFTALAGFLEARSRGGLWLLRIDDLDPNRSRPAAADAIKKALDAAGLHWDGPEFHQSSRVKAYAEGLERLSRDGLVYPCTCSRKDLAQEAGSPAVYPGLCRSRKPGSVRGPHALRVRIPASLVGFEDRLQGQQTQNLETEVGDLILFRRDRVHAYHLATVLDDAEQGVTEVLRGIDLMDSTPRQIYLQERLGLPATTFAHLPILLDRAGHKLGKSSLAPAVATRNPGTLLFRLLELLKQEPPAELKNAPPREILDWAIAHWDLMRLAGLRAVAADPADFDELVPNEADSSGH